MCDYNTFVVFDCKKRNPVMVTSSARKAKRMLCKGRRVDVWNRNEKTTSVYSKDCFMLDKYIGIEKQYISRKQEEITRRNSRRKQNEL